MGTEVPSGVQRQSPGTVSSHPEAEVFLSTLNPARSMKKRCGSKSVSVLVNRSKKYFGSF